MTARLAAAALTALAAAPAAGAEPPPPAWPWTFPLLGRTAVERGAALPLPLGLSLAASWQRDDVVISDVLVGLGTTQLVPADFLEMGRIRNDSYALTARADLWVLPMVNVYALGGPIWTRTQVAILQPYGLAFPSEARGFNGGFGGTGALGNEWGFVSLDANVTWTFLDILSRPQVTFMVDPRVGHRFEPLGGVHLSAWVGGTYQTMVSRSVGSVPLSGAIDLSILSVPPDPDWVATLSPSQQQHLADILAQGAVAAQTPGSRIYFDLQVKPVEPWSMNAGFQVELGPSWVVMGEANFLGSRRGLLLLASYRLGI